VFTSLAVFKPTGRIGYQLVLLPIAMKVDWTESFYLFLTWINPDPDQAAREYEKLRQKLIAIFNNRGCHMSEDLADETFNRVMRRLPEMIDSYEGPPIRYIYITAQNVYNDYFAKAWPSIPEDYPDQPQENNLEDEVVYQCLDHCLDKLSPANRELVLSYYHGGKQAKINHRKEIAANLKIEINAVRIRLYRARNTLRQCIEDCIERDSQNRTN
jgi:RNA polymerase sigma factor (sigma-70 family)